MPITYGQGLLGEIASRCNRAGAKKPLIVTDRGSRNLPFIENVQTELSTTSIAFGLFSDVSPNPRDTEVAAGCAMFRDGGHDGVIAIGGGSGMDAGKAICLQALTQRDLWSFDFDVPPTPLEPQMRFPPLITVPTTAGSGAETAGTAMITHTAKEMKLCVWHPDFDPALCILDPTLTLDLPPHLTAWTGCDALVHAIEAYCVPVLHPMCDGIALQAIKLIWENLPRAVEAPDDLAARSGMLIGSCLAGVSFLKGLGLVHAISHMIGAEYDTHHGLTNAVVLPSVLDFNSSAIAAKIPNIAGAIGAPAQDYRTVRYEIVQLLRQLEVPKSLGDLGVKRDSIASIARRASLDVAASTNPRRATIEEICSIIEHAFADKRQPDLVDQ